MVYAIQTNKKCIIGQGTYGVSTVPSTVAKIIIETIYCSTAHQPIPEVFLFTLNAGSARQICIHPCMTYEGAQLNLYLSQKIYHLIVSISKSLVFEQMCLGVRNMSRFPQRSK